MSAVIGIGGYAAAGLAATGSPTRGPLSSDTLAQIQADLHSAMTLELVAVADIKKGTPKANKNLLIALRQASAHLTAASTALAAAGFRASPPYNPISNAANAVNAAVSSRQPAKTRIAALHGATDFETKALALLPALAVAPSTTTATVTTPQTTTSG
ncbi:MAG TPA: hypothetical protein VKT83_16320 [bacterium]|nr:hypothetical protein [bacterium]